MRDMKYYIIIVILFLVSERTSAENNWQIIGKMPHAVYGAEAVVVDSVIYILGGYSDSLAGSINLIQAYDPENNIWRKAGEMVESRYSFVAAALQDSLIISCGGVWTDSPNIFSVELWNNKSYAVDNAKVISYNSNFNRIYFTGHIYERRLYLFGGLPSITVTDTTSLPFIVNFDPFSESVNMIEDSMYHSSNILPYHHISVQLDSLVYIMGGVIHSLSNRVFVFNFRTNKLKMVGHLRSVRAGGKAVVYDNRIYLIGGYNEMSKALASVEIFNTNMDRANDISALNYARNELMAAVYKDEIYVFGGKDRDKRVVPWIEKLDFSTATSSLVKETMSVGEFNLSPNYPNPFNSTTVIKFDVKRSRQLRLDIFSISGKCVKTLANRKFLAGPHRFTWDGKDQNGSTLASGVYIYKLWNSNISMSRKMILVK
jgi:hypothetical protein